MKAGGKGKGMKGNEQARQAVLRADKDSRLERKDRKDV